jgi:hypothetical protein
VNLKNILGLKKQVLLLFYNKFQSTTNVMPGECYIILIKAK